MTDETLTVGGYGSFPTDPELREVSLPEAQGPPALAGVRLYSPLAIALYSFLANLPLALALLGLNLRARGRRGLGGLLLLVAAVGALSFLVPSDIPRGPLERAKLLPCFIDLAIAYGLYRIEKRPYLDALALGATTARWWVPAIWLLIFLVAGLVYLGA